MPNIAVVGSGYWGKNLVRNFSQIGVLYAICDCDNSRVKQLKDDYPDVNVVAAFFEVLNMDEIDAVVIATPAEYHYQMAKEVILSGKRSEEHTSELQSHSFISYAVFCLKKKK